MRNQSTSELLKTKHVYFFFYNFMMYTLLCSFALSAPKCLQKEKFQAKCNQIKEPRKNESQKGSREKKASQKGAREKRESQKEKDEKESQKGTKKGKQTRNIGPEEIT